MPRASDVNLIFIEFLLTTNTDRLQLACGPGLGGGVGRGLGLGCSRGTGVGRGVADGVDVTVGVEVAVAVALGVGVGVPPACTSNEPLSIRPLTTRSKPGPR